MAADAFHKSIEEGMRDTKNVEDFYDFERIIQSKGIALRMNCFDFKKYDSKLSQAKDTLYPYMEDIVVVRFVKGSYKMFWKESMMEKDFRSGKFLQKKFVDAKVDPFPHHPSPKGFPITKKVEIIKKLCPLMVESRKLFWEELTEQ